MKRPLEERFNGREELTIVHLAPQGHFFVAFVSGIPFLMDVGEACELGRTAIVLGDPSEFGRGCRRRESLLRVARAGSIIHSVHFAVACTITTEQAKKKTLFSRLSCSSSSWPRLCSVRPRFKGLKNAKGPAISPTYAFLGYF